MTHHRQPRDDAEWHDWEHKRLEGVSRPPGVVAVLFGLSVATTAVFWVFVYQMSGHLGGLKDSERDYIQRIACERAVCPTPEAP